MRYPFLVLIAVALIFSPWTEAAVEPVVYFSFDNIDGDTVPDLSGNGNDGTLQDGPEEVQGQLGEGLAFAGSRVMIPASDTLTTELFKEGEFTLVAWINPTRVGNAWQQIFRAGPDPNDTLFLNNDGTLSWRGWVGGAWAGGMCEFGPNAVEADVWSHVAVYSDASDFRLYVNGEQIQESAFQETRGNNQEYMISGYAGGESYTGAVDDFAVFDQPLSQAEIENIMNNGVASAAAVAPAGKLPSIWSAIKNR